MECLSIGIPLLSGGIFYARFRREPHIINPIMLRIITPLLSLVSFVIGRLVCAYVSRSSEYKADRMAAERLCNAQDGIAFIKIVHLLVEDSHLGQKNPESFSKLRRLFLSHPTTRERIENLRTVCKEDEVS
ncbi:M48 family metalloprotease [Candidatus Babeliales bacterium]|nr:M48 family metalloprotease [Candidatus Babeliales bacterium]